VIESGEDPLIAGNVVLVAGNGFGNEGYAALKIHDYQ
jgi:hypothetical protein